MTSIELQNVSKKFATTSTNRTAQEIFLSQLRRLLGRTAVVPQPDSGMLWALRNVSFVVATGETLGLIGHNGAGKSSLLKLISGVLRPTSGQITVNGRLSALLELGAGFHLDLTGRENIFLNGSILGIDRRLLHSQIEEIVDFAELGDFINMPVKHYSSGMLVRLGFAIATSMEPEVLLVDEVLAVGDLAFQAKCINRINKLKANGTTIVFVSHEPGLIRKLCDRCVWLEGSQVQQIGPSAEVMDKYEAAMLPADAILDLPGLASRVKKRWGSRVVEITSVRCLDSAGSLCQKFVTGQPFTVEICYQTHQPIELPSFGIAIYRADGVHVNGTNTTIERFPLQVLDGQGCVFYHLDPLPLLAGDYELTVAIYDHESIHPYDHHHRMYTFTVGHGPDTRRIEGLVRLPASWQHQARPPLSEGVKAKNSAPINRADRE